MKKEVEKIEKGVKEDDPQLEGKVVVETMLRMTMANIVAAGDTGGVRVEVCRRCNEFLYEGEACPRCEPEKSTTAVGAFVRKTFPK